MDLLIYFFQKPMSHAIGWGTALFVVFYFFTRSRRNLSWVIFAGIIIEIIFVSLHFTARMNNIVITKDIAYQVMNYSLLLLWMSHLLEKDGFRLVPNPMNLPVFLFLAICILCSYTSPRIFWYYAVEWASRYGASVALFYLMVQFVNTRRRWNLTLYTLLAMMAITSIYGIMQVRGYDFMSWGRIVNVSTFGNKDFFASFLTYTTPIALFMAIGARNLFDGGLYLSMALLGFYNMWTGETRGAWVGMMALACLTFLFESRFGRLQKWLGSRRKQAIFWGSTIAIIVALSPLLMSKHRLDTFQSIFQFHKGTNIIRVYMWWTAGRMIWDSPVLGQGLGASHVTYPFFRPDRYHRIGMSHNTDYVHSEELQFLCEQGIIGFSIWLAMLLVFFYIVYQKLKTMDDLTERYTLYGVAGSFFAAIVHDSMNVNLRWTSSMLAFWAVMALGTRYVIGFDAPAEGRAAIQKESRRRTSRMSESISGRVWALFPLIVGGFMFMFYGQYRVLRGDWSLKNTEDGSGRPAINSGLDTLKHIPYSHSAYYKVAFHYLNENKLGDAMDMYNRLLNIAPNYAQTHQNTGLIAYRLFGTLGKRKYLYQSVLEFEWATELENNFDNHTKLLQLHTQLLNNSSRGRYHNQYIFWNVLEDSFFNTWRYYIDIWNQPNASPTLRQQLSDDYMKPIAEASKAYWLYRTDTVRRVGRPRDEVRYAMKMSTRYEHENVNLLQYAIGSLTQAGDNEPLEDLLYLISVIENIDLQGIPGSFFMQTQQTLVQQNSGKPMHPALAYGLGILSYRAGDIEKAREFFQVARMSGESRYEFIREGLKKYGI